MAKVKLKDNGTEIYIALEEVVKQLTDYERNKLMTLILDYRIRPKEEE